MHFLSRILVKADNGQPTGDPLDLSSHAGREHTEVVPRTLTKGSYSLAKGVRDLGTVVLMDKVHHKVEHGKSYFLSLIISLLTSEGA